MTMLLKELMEYKDSVKVFAETGDILIHNGFLIDQRTEDHVNDIPDVWSILRNSRGDDYYSCPYCGKIHTSHQSKGTEIIPDCFMNHFPTKKYLYEVDMKTGEMIRLPIMKIRLHREAKVKHNA